MFPLGISLTFHCAITRRDPADQVEYVTVAHPGPGNLRAWASDGT